MKKIFVLFLGVLMLGACAKHATEDNRTAFNREEAMMLLREGSSTISGSAAIKGKNNTIVSCAGKEVELTPATPYAVEKMTNIFGNNQIGYLPEYKPTNSSFNPDFVSYGQRKVMCDNEGRFQFNNVRQGEYFVSAHLSSVDGQPGGYIMRRVTVGDQETRDVVFTQNEWKK